MRVMIVGATGIIGKEVANLLSRFHDVVRVGHSSGDFQVDLESKGSISDLYDRVGSVDAVVCTAGNANFAPFAQLTDADFELALTSKLMGQVNLVRLGQDHLKDGGSFTLTSGMMAHSPMPGSVAVSMANGALQSFVKAAALELEKSQRINVVSPRFVKETMVLMGMDPAPGISASDSANAYLTAIEGAANGEILDVAEHI